ncbi:MAG: hypothetical protein DRI24_19805, partial [Deltaproteobacteria bacterium]
LKHEEIQGVIEQYRKPEKPPKPGLKLLEDKAIQAQQESVRANKSLESKDAQIAKLKATVKRQAKELVEKDKVIAALQEELRKVLAPLRDIMPIISSMEGTKNDPTNMQMV